jgi:hypothetical protein
MTRYQASALLSFQFNRKEIQRLVTAANEGHANSHQSSHASILEAA